MDPIDVEVYSTADRFPRPRGDGPWRFVWWIGIPMVSPPTRGWTVLEDALIDGAPGFPAHAGMDPRSRSQRPQHSRFPRPRGDGPAITVAEAAALTVSPPTRGWTPAGPHGERPWRGFPAHAGMDPRTASMQAAESWFPRPRGDGPKTSDVAVTYTKVSPPTRGWTPGTPYCCLRGTGFPAHAGMDPREPSCLITH